ncbi:MAG: restriction endonuclease subunit S [Bacteroidota bacterium]|nr:restriction endonuclease subunit S [Bacteroidota bacterium]
MNLIGTGKVKGHIRFDEDRNFITYIHQNKKRSYNNPEEKVHAETFLSLILIYGYPVNRIQQFVSVQMGAQPNISETDIMKIFIPVPTLAKQKEIADHIMAIKQQAQKLKDKSKKALAQASKEIECILIG